MSTRRRITINLREEDAQDLEKMAEGLNTYLESFCALVVREYAVRYFFCMTHTHAGLGDPPCDS